MLDTNLLLGLAGLLLSIVSLLYAIHVTRISNKEKKLVYEVMTSIPVADVVRSDSSFSLKLLFENSEGEDQYIQNAAIQYIRFTNFGKIPIVKDDVSSSDPLKLIVSGGKVLDISLISATRDVCQISLDQYQVSNNIFTTTINFDFIDYLDGGLIQILSDTTQISSEISGTVIGMPLDIKKVDLSESSNMSWWSCVILALLELGGVASVPLLWKYFTGGFDKLWLLVLPIIALIVPAILFVIPYAIFNSKAKLKFPDQLITPPWYDLRKEFMYPNYRSLERDLIEHRRLEKTQESNSKNN